VVGAGLQNGDKCTASPNSGSADLKAVNAYFLDPDSINRLTKALAANLDASMNTAVNTAETNALNRISCGAGGNARQQGGQAKKQAAVTAAKVGLL
jgi:hypothetical protein